MTVPSCPACTRLRANHRELTNDIYAFPIFASGRHGAAYDEAHPEEVAKGNGRTRWLVVEGCQHARLLDAGEWRSEAEIEGAWQEIVERLNAERAVVSK